MRTKDIKKVKRNWRRYVELTGITRSQMEDATGIPYGRIIDLGRAERPNAIPTNIEIKAVSELVVEHAERIQRRVLNLEFENGLTAGEFKKVNSDFSGIPVPQDVSIVGRHGMITTAPANSDIETKRKIYNTTVSAARRSRDDVEFDDGVIGMKKEFTFLRGALCLSHWELADMSGYSPQTIEDWGRLNKIRQTPHPELLFEMRRKASGWAHQVIQQSQAPHAGGDEFFGIVSPVLPLEYSGAIREVTFRRTSS